MTMKLSLIMRRIKLWNSHGNKGSTIYKWARKIYRKNVSSDDDEDNDDIYLDSINLSAGSIDFSRKKAEFDVVVDKDVDVLDNVEFESEIYKTPEVEIKLAMFVKSLTKEHQRQKMPK